MALHSRKWNMAAMRVTRPLHNTCSPRVGRPIGCASGSHETRRLLDGPSAGLGTILALMADGAIDTFNVHDLPDDVRAPRYSRCWMFVKDISTVGSVVRIQLTAEANVSHTPFI